MGFCDSMLVSLPVLDLGMSRSGSPGFPGVFRQLVRALVRADAGRPGHWISPGNQPLPGVPESEKQQSRTDDRVHSSCVGVGGKADCQLRAMESNGTGRRLRRPEILVGSRPALPWGALQAGQRCCRQKDQTDRHPFDDNGALQRNRSPGIARPHGRHETDFVGGCR